MKPLIFSSTTDEVEFVNTVNEWLKYVPMSLCGGDNKETQPPYCYDRLFALTLTITPNDKHKLVSNGADVRDYFAYILTELGLNNSIFIMELTKKKVEHIHGFVQISRQFDNHLRQESIKIKGKYQSIYKDDRLQYQHVFKKINTRMASSGWTRYMAKGCIHKTVLDYLEQQEMIKKVDSYFTSSTSQEYSQTAGYTNP